MRRLSIFLSFLLLITLPIQAQTDLDTEELEHLLEDFVWEDEPGVVLYVQIGDESWIGAQGLANLETGEAVQTDDLFRIGSITKTLVATIILQLVDDSELSLDDPIAEYLPQAAVENIANADTATVRQMLQMTSGIFSYTDSDDFNDAVDDNPFYAWTASEALETIYGYEADFPTGEDYTYSNSNYLLAELLIETITGDSLANNLEARIFEPLDMSSCFLETADRFAENIVRGYALDDDDDFIDITEVNDGVGLGDGGVICSAADLAKFPLGLRDDLLSDTMLDDMLTTVDDGDGGQYGLGIAYEDGEFGLQAGHDGSTSGFQSNMVYLVEEDVTVVILTNNFDSDIVEDLTIEAQAIALGDF